MLRSLRRPCGSGGHDNQNGNDEENGAYDLSGRGRLN
jgi:hypothetical protein